MIRAEIIGTNRASALGVEVVTPAPVLALCRKLVAAGHDPSEPLEAYRGGVLCLKVRTIGEGAKLTVDERTTVLAKYSPPPSERIGRIYHCPDAHIAPDGQATAMVAMATQSAPAGDP